jgi:2-methylfumaryl-CoA isomerase
MIKILKGLRVVEGSAFVAVPSGGMTLAQLGADVIRFDVIGGGLDAERWPITREGRSLYWAGLNKGKRSLAVDIRRPEGRALVANLITAPGADAGLFLTNLPATGWISYETLKQARPDLIMLTLTGNPDGTTAVDYTVNCGVGFPFMTGPVDKPAPINHVLPAWDLICGQQAALGLLAAERHRRSTGDGQLIKLSLADVAYATMGNLGFIGEAQINGADRPAVGNHIFGSFGRDFETNDGRRIMVVALTRRQWRALGEVTDLTGAFATSCARLSRARRSAGVRIGRQPR